MTIDKYIFIDIYSDNVHPAEISNDSLSENTNYNIDNFSDKKYYFMTIYDYFMTI